MNNLYTRFDAVVIACSYGAVPSLQALVSCLPPRFPAAILVAYHAARRSSFMADILRKTAQMPVDWAQHGEMVTAGRIIMAVPDYHLLVNEDRTLALSQSERLHFVRPSADLLFDSAAEAWGSRTIGIIMSGLGRDGALGARAIKNAGGRVLVQDRTSCASFEMPRAAIETGSADFVLPLEDLASALIALVTVPGAADLFRVTPGFSLANAYRYLQREGGAPARLVMKPGMAL